jgi:hypothetical protein
LYTLQVWVFFGEMPDIQHVDMKTKGRAISDPAQFGANRLIPQSVN